MRIQLRDNVASLLDTTSVREWWAAIDSGAAPFVFHARPATSQHDARIVATEATELRLDRPDGQYIQHLEQTWRETPPYRETEI